MLNFLKFYMANIRTYSNIQIFLDKYIHSYIYLLNFEATNIFGYSFVRKVTVVTHWNVTH